MERQVLKVQLVLVHRVQLDLLVHRVHRVIREFQEQSDHKVQMRV